MEETEKRPLKMVKCGKCGKAAFIPPELPPLTPTPCKNCGHEIIMPLQLRQFELRSPIASGGMGTVYRAWDIHLLREVAVKLMKEELASDAAAVEEFKKEARACATLNHTNIIHIYEFNEVDGLPYLVMELANSGSLDNRIEDFGRVSELDVLDVGIKVTSALDAALRHNLLHLDIKPGNILFNAENEPKVVDFGLAKRADVDGVTADEEGIMGTPYYIAPERVLRHSESFLSDMYSLAATLYHALLGQVPFDGDTINDVALAHTNIALTPPRDIDPEITQPTNDALMCAMAKSPSERFQSYDEFRMELEAARSSLFVKRYMTQED